MIIIFEPQCRGFAHEQFNAGFLYGYLLAYPQERIVFWGEKEHIKCLQAVFNSANLAFEQVEFVEVEIPEPNKLSRISVIFEYHRLLEELFLYASRNNCNKIVLLSIYSYNLLPLKYLIKWRYKNFFQFHIMMHGTLEFVKRNNFSIPFANYFLKLFKLLGRLFKLPNVKFQLKPTNKYLYEKLFKTSLQFLGNENIAYFVFREDSLKSVKKYLPEIHQCFKSIDLPYIFKDAPEKDDIVNSNKKIFATIGRSDLPAVQNVVRKLNDSIDTGEDNFEIQIVGPGKIAGDNLGQIKYTGDGRTLSRTEIEERMTAIQYVLFFYDSDSYELTTSGSFFDAIAYCKPMIFLINRCFDYYYQNYRFGHRCENISELVITMEKIITGKDDKYLESVSEIKRMQNNVSIRNNYFKLTFDE